MLWLLSLLEHLIVLVVAALAYRTYSREGWPGLLRVAMQGLRTFPPLNALITNLLSGEVKKFTSKVTTLDSGKKSDVPAGAPKVPIPKQGIPHKEILEEMRELKAHKASADGKMFALVYTRDDENFKLQKEVFDIFTTITGLEPDQETLLKEAYKIFMHENALNPMEYPALRKFENEVVSMTASMLNGDADTVGCMTSGGTESILMAMKAYRDRAATLWPHITNPEMVAAQTIHPAHEKAASYFGFKIIHIPVKDDYRPDMKKFAEAIGPNTIALLSSAPEYAHGIMDPIEEVAALAVQHDLPLHVDACFGGFMLPWVEKLGYPLQPFDFRVPGVTSISADIHKYGYATKGASVILYKNSDYRKYQMFSYSQWPGGLFGSPSMAGSRPGGNIAAAWAILKAMGQDGYLKVAKGVMETTDKLKNGIWSIPGLCILGQPQMSAFAIGSCDPEVSIMAVADLLEAKGWTPERNQYPDSLHATIMPAHAAVADELLVDLAECATTVKRDKTLAKKGTAAMYGMVASIPDKTLVDDFTVEFFSQVYKL